MGFVYLITIADRYNLFSQSRRFTGRASYNINFISPIIQFGVNKTEQDRNRTNTVNRETKSTARMTNVS